MKPDMKAVLEEAFAAPEAKHKKEFLQSVRQPQISTFEFMRLQASYIRKRVWLVSVLILVMAVMSAGFVGKDSIAVISAMIPFIALCAVAESARSEVYCMAELEMASRFSLRSIMLARLGMIGGFHVLILCVLVPFVGKSALLPFAQVGVYLSIPYLLTSILGLVAVRKVHGKEAIYLCMGISVVMSFLNLTLKEQIPGIYEGKWLIWWCILGVYLSVKVWSEYKKAIYQTEELAWS